LTYELKEVVGLLLLLLLLQSLLLMLKVEDLRAVVEACRGEHRQYL